MRELDQAPFNEFKHWKLKHTSSTVRKAVKLMKLNRLINAKAQ